jgi:hypothetical protein
MIIWLASYPKSGNTLIRSMLSAYFFTKDGNFNFKVLSNIKQFPDFGVFKNLGIDISNENEVVKNYINIQKQINIRDGKTIRFLKTHSGLQDINGHKFTNQDNTLGAIYIVRDPRNIIKSYANHNQVSIKEALKMLQEFRVIGGLNDRSNKSVMHVGSWSSHYKSWKELKKVNRYLLVKYEDLVFDPKKIFLEILDFIYKVNKTNYTLDEAKLENVLKTTGFDYIRDLEKKNNFPEAAKDLNENDVQFFKYGPKSDWKDHLSEEILLKLEKLFKNEMNELGYL